MKFKEEPLLKVKVMDYGYSDDLASYYVIYKASGLNTQELLKLKEKVEDPAIIRCEELYLTVYYEEEFYPFHTEDSKKNPEDFIAREEIEMTAYLLDLMEED
jgi:Family of unknown function (DUF5750)